MADFLVRLGTTQAIATNGSGTEGTNMITIPIPSTYKTTSTTIVDSARNSSGYVIASVIRSGIRKIEMSWLVIGIADYSKMAKFFNTHFSFFAYYFDMDNNAYTTKEMYVGDREANALQNSQISISSGKGYILKIENFNLSLVEI